MNLRKITLLYLGGFNLILLQFFIIREVNAILRSTEIIILITTLAYFSGFSIGYWMAGRIAGRSILILACGTWIIHLTLPFSVRYLTGLADQYAKGLNFLVVLFFTAFCLSTFYSLLLPRFIDDEGTRDRMAVYYGAELAGAATCIAVLVLQKPIGLLANHYKQYLDFLPESIIQTPATLLIPVLYQAVLVIVIFLLIRRMVILPLGAVALTLYILAFPRLEGESLAYIYNHLHDFHDSEVLYSVNSPYQKVDIVREKEGRTYLYLDGGMNFGSNELSWFNAFLSELPARLQKPEKVLIVGSGSMQSVARVSPLAKHVKTVELDPAVIAGSRIHFAHINHLSEIQNWQWQIDDAKHYLGSTDEKYDLVIMDVPAPLTIQEGLLHSVEFYRLVKARLKPQGIISVSLSGGFRPDAETPRAVAASLLQVFDKIYVITAASAGRSFAFAGEEFKFSKLLMEATMQILGEINFDVYERDEIEKIVGEMRPISLSNMRFIVHRSWVRLIDNLRED